MLPTEKSDFIQNAEALGVLAQRATGTAEDILDSPTGSSPSPSVPVECKAHQEKAGDEAVRLLSSEGKYVDVPVKVAMECELLARMLSGPIPEIRKREISLPNIRYRTLCKVVDYLRRRVQWREGGGAPLEFEVDDDVAVELLIAADFLGIK